MSNRSANIGADLERDIIDLIKTIKDKITWIKVIDLIESKCGERYTEQGLRKRESIATAYRLQKKVILRAKGIERQQANAEDMARKIVRLQEEREINLRLINQLYDKFRIWAYNAKEKGLTEEMLNRPLEFVDYYDR